MATALARQTALKQYFTDAPEVNSAMAELLGNVQNLSLLEPSVGNGALLSRLVGIPKCVDAIDVDVLVLAHTKQRYPSLNIEPHQADFIDIFVDDGLFKERDILKTQYDAVISNPPFGLFFSVDYRKRLKTILPDMYVRESYGLFLIFSLMKLVDGGRYVFLLPDTFLTSKNHSSLRRYLLQYGKPSHIIRFPSKRFETVNFGYGNLCIIAGNKASTSDDASLTWTEAFCDTSPLLQQPESSTARFTGVQLRANISNGWRSSMAEIRSELQDWTTLGEIADCKTGIYSGNNEQFVGFDPSRINKRMNGHSIDWEMVHQGPLTAEQKRNGLSGDKLYVPLIRGGHRSFNARTAWAIRWDAEAISFYKTNKKARLQNLGFYFKTGLAVPMVTARRLSASLMDSAIFDQGVVGVFPYNTEAREAVLIYLNSSLATNLRNDIVNGSANNSANYLKRLPIPIFRDYHLLEAKGLFANSVRDGVLQLEVCDEFVNQFLTKRDRQSSRSAAM
ncbi:MAG TPA: N-6 DNA methylase [Sphingobium sp.]|nr:N-6 DNA methylase [Sphingobium sp.]